MRFVATDLEVPIARADSGIEWEECDCPLCGGHSWSPLVEAPDRLAGNSGRWFLVVQCHDCGLCFTNPRPSHHSMTQFYASAYPAHANKTPRLPWWRRMLSRLRRDNRKCLPLEGNGRLLDFGCGGGSYLLRMHEQGWDVTGLDLAASAIQTIPSRRGLRTFVGTLPHAELRDETFDVITMWQSLEHVHEPQEVLREARRLLAPGGKLIIATPNIDSLPFRWFGHAWYGLDLPRHLTHFAPWTLRLMLHRAGFRVGRIRMVRHSSWLRSSAHAACREPYSNAWHRWLRNRTPSALATWFTYLTRQCDCMMATAWRR
jgi:2-polyprenyl-3-methyl-5-hydroxy-6-metoxy-1,4-benzoquinol methylase